MGIFSNAFGRERRASLENPSTPLSAADDWLYDAWGAEPTAAGLSMSLEKAFTDSAWFRGVSLVATSIAKLPLILYRREGEDSRERFKEDPRYRLLRYRPNREQSAFNLWLTAIGHKLSLGNGYIFVDRAQGTGRALNLIPLLPDVTWPVRVDGELRYSHDVNGEMVVLQPEDVIHLKGLGYDGLVGYSVFRMAREELGLGVGAREYGSRVFSNAATGKMVLEHPATMDDDAQRRFLKAYQERFAGLTNAHKAIILEQGMTAKPIAFNAKDAQLLELRELHVREIANFVGVPPHKLGDTTRTSHASLEQENQAMLDDLDPHMVDAEQELWAKILTEDEKDRDDRVVEFLRQALIRVDLKTRTESYAKAVGGPYMTANEARRRESMPDIEGGDVLNQPQGAPAANGSGVGGDEEGEGEEEGNGRQLRAESVEWLRDTFGASSLGGDDELRDACRILLQDTRRRMTRRLGVHVRKAARDYEAFASYLVDLVARKHDAIYADALRPVTIAVARVERGNALALLEEELSNLFRSVRETGEFVYKTAAREEFADALDNALSALEAE